MLLKFKKLDFKKNIDNQKKNHFKLSKNALNNLWQHIAFHVILTIRMSTKLFHKFCKSMFFYPLKAHDWLDVILNLLLFWMIYHIYHISERGKKCLNLYNVWCIKFHSKHSTVLLLCLLPTLMHQELCYQLF